MTGCRRQHIGEDHGSSASGNSLVINAILKTLAPDFINNLIAKWRDDIAEERLASAGNLLYRGDNDHRVLLVAPWASDISGLIRSWTPIITAFTIIVGTCNLLMVHWRSGQPEGPPVGLERALAGCFPLSL